MYYIYAMQSKGVRQNLKCGLDKCYHKKNTDRVAQKYVFNLIVSNLYANSILFSMSVVRGIGAETSEVVCMPLRQLRQLGTPQCV